MEGEKIYYIEIDIKYYRLAERILKFDPNRYKDVDDVIDQAVRYMYKKWRNKNG